MSWPSTSEIILYACPNAVKVMEKIATQIDLRVVMVSCALIQCLVREVVNTLLKIRKYLLNNRKKDTHSTTTPLQLQEFNLATH